MRRLSRTIWKCAQSTRLTGDAKVESLLCVLITSQRVVRVTTRWDTKANRMITGPCELAAYHAAQLEKENHAMPKHTQQYELNTDNQGPVEDAEALARGKARLAAMNADTDLPAPAKTRKPRADKGVPRTPKPASKPTAVKPVAASPIRKRGNAPKVAKIDGKSKRLVRLTERIIKAAAKIKRDRAEFDALLKAQDKLRNEIKS